MSRSSSPIVHQCDGLREDFKKWKRKYPDIEQKVDLACSRILTKPGAWERGERDGRFFQGARKLRLPMGNQAAVKGYRLVYLAISIEDTVHIIVAAMYPKPAYSENEIPIALLNRVATEVAANIERITGGGAQGNS